MPWFKKKPRDYYWDERGNKVVDVVFDVFLIFKNGKTQFLCNRTLQIRYASLHKDNTDDYLSIFDKDLNSFNTESVILEHDYPAYLLFYEKDTNILRKTELIWTWPLVVAKKGDTFMYGHMHRHKLYAVDNNLTYKCLCGHVKPLTEGLD